MKPSTFFFCTATTMRAGRRRRGKRECDDAAHDFTADYAHS